MNDVRQYCLWDLQRIAKEHLRYDENLQLIANLCKEWQLIELTEYVKKHNLKDNTVRYQLKNGKIPHIEISKTIFIIEKLIV